MGSQDSSNLVVTPTVESNVKNAVRSVNRAKHTRSPRRQRGKPIIVNTINELNNPECGLSPVIDRKVRFLICGTFPAKESIEADFYYQNQTKRFWGQALKLIGDFEDIDNNKCKVLLLENNIGLWDIFECIERDGGNQDSAIKKAKYNSFEKVIKKYPMIEYLVFNGKNAFDWLKEDNPKLFNNPDLKFQRLQSSSGSNGHFKAGEDWKEFFGSNGFKKK